MFINEKARGFVLHTMFTAQKETTELLLADMQVRGLIRMSDPKQTAVRYVYLLHGLNLENHLRALEGASPEETGRNLIEHITEFIRELRC